MANETASFLFSARVMDALRDDGPSEALLFLDSYDSAADEEVEVEMEMTGESDNDDSWPLAVWQGVYSGPPELQGGDLTWTQRRRQVVTAGAEAAVATRPQSVRRSYVHHALQSNIHDDEYASVRRVEIRHADELCQLLSSCERLVELRAIEGAIGDIDMHLPVSLRLLDLSSNRIGSLAGLSRLRNLQTLVLDGNPVHESTLAELRHVRSLEQLSLCGTPIKNMTEATAHLKQCKSLRYLYLQRPRSKGIELAPPRNSDDMDLSLPSVLVEYHGEGEDEAAPGPDEGTCGCDMDEIESDCAFEYCEVEGTCADLDGRPCDPVDAAGGSSDRHEQEETEMAWARLSEASNYLARSPVCASPGYRAYLLHNLPHLAVLDWEPITAAERDVASRWHARLFEATPYGMSQRPSLTQLLRAREMGLPAGPFQSDARQSDLDGGCLVSEVSPTTCTEPATASFDTCTLPCATPASSRAASLRRAVGGSLALRGTPSVVCPSLPLVVRQFEYHPSEPHLMAVGSTSGNVLILDHCTGRPLASDIDPAPALSDVSGAVLGLAWVPHRPSMLLAGHDWGGITLFDVRGEALLPAPALGGCRRRVSQTSEASFDATSGDSFSEPDDGIDDAGSEAAAAADDAWRRPLQVVARYPPLLRLTSVTASCGLDVFLASGYTSDVGVYDLETGARIRRLSQLHARHINVIKFANHSPHVFATASFDHTAKLWDLRSAAQAPIFQVSGTDGIVMVCFSPNDRYLLTSAVDNEVSQYCARSGRRVFVLPQLRGLGAQNYTRSYYMNGGDYIVSGSCKQDTLRLCSSRRGRLLREVPIAPLASAPHLPMYVQSLRGDPHHDWRLSVLVNYTANLGPCAELLTLDLAQRPRRRASPRASA